MAYKMLRFLGKVLVAFAGLLVFFGLKVLRLGIKFHISSLRAERIGHLVLGADTYLRLKSEQGPGENVFFVSRKACNSQMMRMIKRRILVVENNVIFEMYRLIRRLFPMDAIWFPQQDGFLSDYTKNEGIDLLSPPFQFTSQEFGWGKCLLKEFGMKPGDPYICFHARDSRYLQIRFESMGERGFSYHDYRDSDIQIVADAVSFFVEKGIPVLRMGSVVAKPLTGEVQGMVDYASSKKRSDFGDIFLSSGCKFFVGDTSGICCIPAAFNVPVVGINIISLGEFPYRRQDLFIVKKFWSKSKNRLLTFREIIELGADQWATSEEFVNAGIDWVDNTADEIRDVVMEMNARLDGHWRSGCEDELLQKKYLALWPKGHRIHRIPVRAGTLFLRKYAHLID